MKKTNPFDRSPSPTLSDGSNPKRPAINYEMCDELQQNEKFQKVRRLDSPTSHDGPTLVQVPSPQSIKTTTSKSKVSPKGGKDINRSTSPKAMYPPPIQKYLNGRNHITMDQAVEKLKIPSKKTFNKSLEAMKFLTSVQQQEVESNIVFRKAYTNSTTSVSPAHSGSPIGSPRTNFSPRTVTASQYQAENIIMTYDDDQMILSPSETTKSESIYDQLDANNPAYKKWNANMMNAQPLKGFNYDNQSFGQGAGPIFGNIPFLDKNSQNPQSGLGNFINQGNMQQGQFGNQFGYQGNNLFSGGSNHLVNQQLIFNASYQGNTNKQKPQGNGGDNLGEETRDRTSSFLVGESNESRDRTSSFLVQDSEDSRERTNSFLMRSLGNIGLPLSQNTNGGRQPDCQSLAANQLSAIQTLVQTKRAISPEEPNRGLLQDFKKRNSNPENYMNIQSQSQHPFQYQQPLFQNQNMQMNQNTSQEYNNNYNTGNQQFNNMQSQFGNQDFHQQNFGNRGNTGHQQMNSNPFTQQNYGNNLFNNGMAQSNEYMGGHHGDNNGNQE